MAEAVLAKLGGADFAAFSAGTEPKGVHPLTIRVLAEVGIDWAGARSKSVREYLGGSFDHVITVCDAAREACPVVPGARTAHHWGFDDPAAAGGTEEEQLAVFRRVLGEITDRVRQFIVVASHGAADPAGRLPPGD
jgi:arsenate reductase